MTESNQNNTPDNTKNESTQPVNNEQTVETANVVRDNGIKYINTLYEHLQQKLDRTYSEPYSFKELTTIGVKIYSTPKTVVNASGNLKIKVKLLLESGAKPNYAEMVLMNGFNETPKMINIPESINILLKTLISPNFVVESTPVTNLDPNPAPNGVRGDVKYQANNPENLLNMLNEHVKNPLFAWNLNYNRNLDINEVKKISAHVMTKFNEIVEYIINNDIKKPDETFRRLVRDIFYSGANIYSFSHFTLMLPALVNYLSRSIGDRTAHATRYIGIVKSGSGLMPKQAGNLRDEIKWREGGSKITVETICPYGFIHNGQFKANIGGYNYPFSKTNYDRNKFRPSTINCNVKLPNDKILKNITFGFKSDNYRYVSPNNMTLAQVNGSHKEPNPEYGYNVLRDEHYTTRTVYTPWSFMTPMVAAVPCVRNWNDTKTERVNDKIARVRQIPYDCNCRKNCTQYCKNKKIGICWAHGTTCTTTCDKCNRNETYYEDNWVNKTINIPGSCNQTGAAIGAYLIGNDRQPVTSRVSASYITGYKCNYANARDCSYTTNRATVEGIGSQVVLYKINSDGMLDSYSTGRYCTSGVSCGAGAPLVTPAEMAPGTEYVKKRTAYMSGNKNNQMIGESDGAHYYSSGNGYKDFKQIAFQTIKRTYIGEFNYKLIAGPPNSECGDKKPSRLNTPDQAKRNPAVTHLYHTLQDINYFCDEVFNDWLWLVQQPKALQKLLDDFRTLITSNPEMLLITKINNQLGEYFRTLDKDDMSLIDLPFGAPLINVGENSMILPEKMYHSEFKVNKGIDTKNNVHKPDYFNNNIINAVQPDTSSSNFKPLNYIDNMYSTMFDLCKYDDKFDETKTLAVTVPKHGCQLFETIANYQDNSSSKRINYSGPLAKILDTTKISDDSLIDNGKSVRPRILAKIGAPLNDKIVDAYELLNSAVEVHVPVINIHKEVDELTVEINTSSVDPANKLYVYVAKVANSLGNYTAKMNSYVNTKTNTPMNVVDIEYDGNESKEVPVILKRRF